MFRSRFSDAFPKTLAHFGPQELERDVVEFVPGDRVEHFLCALLGLLLNRKQDVKCVLEPPSRHELQMANATFPLLGQQARALRQSLGGRHRVSQITVVAGMGTQEPAVRWRHLQLDDPDRKSTPAIALPRLRCR